MYVYDLMLIMCLRVNYLRFFFVVKGRATKEVTCSSAHMRLKNNNSKQLLQQIFTSKHMHIRAEFKMGDVNMLSKQQQILIQKLHTSM